MRVIVAPRKGGKTEALLRWMQEAPDGESRVLVTVTAHEVRRVRELAEERGLLLSGWRFVSFDAVRAGALQGMPENVTLALDNADMMLQNLFVQRVAVATLTGGA